MPDYKNIEITISYRKINYFSALKPIHCKHLRQLAELVHKISPVSGINSICKKRLCQSDKLRSLEQISKYIYISDLKGYKNYFAA